MHLPPLKGIVAFEVVARLGSVNKAADELNVTASAVSHQIANLEDFVGRRLFARTSRGLVLTPVGERYRGDVAGALALIASAAQNARSSEGVEVLRIHVAPSFASLWLMPRLPQFLAEHPDLRVQLSAAFSDSDFSRGEIDLDIRYGPVRGGDLRVETIFSEEILPLASPRLLQRVAIREPNDLLGQPLILSAVNVVQWPRWFAANGVSLSPGTYALTFDRTHLAVEAAARGLGVALDSARLAESFLARGDLVPVFADRKAIVVHAHHIVYPATHGKWRKVERFIAWMREEANKRPGMAPLARHADPAAVNARPAARPRRRQD
jgi:LysR family glycine cleavage system transcriptional activator